VEIEDIRNKLADKELKVTQQRMAILKAIYELDNHPTADNIQNYIRENNPNIAKGTVYNVLETLVEKELIRKVKTDKDIFRYDGVIDKHHHLYCSECDIIEDYVDEELDKILNDYLSKKEIKGFKIDDIVLQIRGTFDKCK